MINTNDKAVRKKEGMNTRNRLNVRVLTRLLVFEGITGGCVGRAGVGTGGSGNFPLLRTGVWLRLDLCDAPIS